MSTRLPPVTVEQMREAYEASAWRGRVPFGQAITRPVIAQALKLGARLLALPPRPLDWKQLAAGERDE
jgi:hypothetical protein